MSSLTWIGLSFNSWSHLTTRSLRGKDCPLHFLRFLEANPKEIQRLKGKRILEVGAGAGLG